MYIMYESGNYIFFSANLAHFKEHFSNATICDV